MHWSAGSSIVVFRRRPYHRAATDMTAPMPGMTARCRWFWGVNYRWGTLSKPPRSASARSPQGCRSKRAVEWVSNGCGALSHR